MKIAPLRYVPATHEGRYNLRVHVNPVTSAGKAITGYLFKIPVLESRCKDFQLSFSPTTEFVLFGEGERLIHIGKGVIADSIITTTVVDVVKEAQGIPVLEPIVPASIS